MFNMEEIVSLPPMEFFNDDYQMVLDFIEGLGNPKFKIAGDVALLGNNRYIKTLGNLVEVDGDLYIAHSDIEILPESLNVVGNFDLTGCVKILKLPNNLHVGGFLDLSYTNMTKLPDNLYVGGLLNLYNSEIDEIPNNLTIEGYLNLNHNSHFDIIHPAVIKKMIIDKGGFIEGNIYNRYF